MAISPIPHWFEGSEYTHKVAACIMKYGPISRITLAQILGLSQGTVSRITSDLIYAGVIEETPMAPGQGGRLPKDFVRKNSQKAAQKSGQKENTERRGRPQTGLRIVANARTFVGMKINTTHITAVAVNAIGQIVTGCHDLPLDDDSPESVVDVIKQLTMDCADEAVMSGLPAPCAVGVSLGGHITDDSVTTFAPFLHWSKPVEFSAMIRKATGLPTGIYNDIDSLAVDACLFGSGVGLNSFAVVTIGIGVGYSLTVNGEPIDNPDKSYGLVGHTLVDPDGPRCISGHKGCATCLTDNSIATEYSEIIGHPATFDEFAAAARASKTQATNLVNRTCFRLGTLIATIANLAMPDKIMIAGESSFIAKLGIDNLRNGINMYRHSQAAPVDFEIAEHDWSLWSKAAAAQAIRQYVG
ncbi:ROK family transcriptional regulator [Bifidobacterium adolescentis]|uniref:NagC/XylR-type transcriptional regulator n=1 Tax=Bifidobacterium adolescentis TaxID=1680 RepID=A0A174BKE4_BIFAD|nr:ROK family transcriptional regulator [Bifidobacterium adolescentis]CUO01204.1 NagC/XylR-type transcriptional regulator [Bifidobacterium adolescentis]